MVNHAVYAVIQHVEFNRRTSTSIVPHCGTFQQAQTDHLFEINCLVGQLFFKKYQLNGLFKKCLVMQCLPCPRTGQFQLFSLFHLQIKQEWLRPGLGPNNKNTVKNSLNSCQIFRSLTNISDCVNKKQF
jgi:hypothetical protein